ncbi:MAG: hypothetical protein AABM42_07385 [Actinomycetota bacterium]
MSEAPKMDALAEALAPLVVEQLARPVADRVVEFLRESGEGPRMLSTREVAARVGRSPDWVYVHQQELGVVPLGKGPRPRLGFRSEVVDAYLDGEAR